jgi:hypothetical protein
VTLSLACGITSTTETDIQEARFDTAALRIEFERLGLQPDISKSPNTENGPPSKRRKIAEAEGPYLFDAITSDLYGLLGKQMVGGLAGLHKVAE